MSLLDQFGGGVPTVPVMQVPQTPNVSSMLQSQPMAQPSGPAALPPNPQGPPSFLERLKARLMPVPTGMRGLLSDEDLGNARNQGLLNFGLSMLAHSRGQGGGNAPSVGQALADSYGAGQQAFGGGVDKAVNANIGGLQTSQMLRILQARQQLGQQLGPVEGESRAQAIDRLMQMFHGYAAVGDTEMLGKLSDVLGKLGEDPAMFRMQHGKEPVQVSLGGKTLLLDPYTWEPITALSHAPTPVNPQEFGQKQLQDAGARTGELVTQFQGATKDIGEAGNTLRNISAVKQSALAGDPASQIALLDNFLRLNNPGGIARPAQISMAAEARSLMDKLRLFVQNPATGAKLSSGQVARFVNAANQVGQQWKTKYQPIEKQYRTRASEMQVDPNAVIVDPFTGVDFSGGAPPAATGAPSSSNVRRYLPKPAAAPVVAPAAPPAVAPKPAAALPPPPGLLKSIQNLLFAPKAFPDNMGVRQ